MILKNVTEWQKCWNLEMQTNLVCFVEKKHQLLHWSMRNNLVRLLRIDQWCVFHAPPIISLLFCNSPQQRNAWHPYTGVLVNRISVNLVWFISWYQVYCGSNSLETMALLLGNNNHQEYVIISHEAHQPLYISVAAFRKLKYFVLLYQYEILSVEVCRYFLSLLAAMMV